MILIIADSFDTHADVVEAHLLGLKCDFFRLNLDVESLKLTILSFVSDEWTISQNGKLISSNQITCVWPRRLTVSLTVEQQHSNESNSFRLWKSEWNRCLYGMYAHLRNCFWMNPVSYSSLADNKYYQFNIAKRYNFNIPIFISSNDKNDLQTFCLNNNSAIKFMTQDIFRKNDGNINGIYVNRIFVEDLDEFKTSCENPITLQRYISKKYEVRHTFVDGKHFCCKIESQASERANVDWRRYDVAHTPHSAMIAPKEISNQIEAFMAELGLTYGAFDFIVDMDEKWWYLEVNSAGQWLWIEDLTGLKISEQIAQTLANRV